MNRGKEFIENYLNNNGISNQPEVDEIISGFDLSQPIYKQTIWPDDQLYQFIRNPSSSFHWFQASKWFCLKGATMDSLGIFSGGSGRSLTEFKVTYSIVGLEGTAKEFARDWSWAGGGSGGATQIFIPKKMFYAIECVGACV